jgi:hypothetical protein
MVDFKQLDFDFSGDFLNVAAPAASASKLPITHEQQTQAAANAEAKQQDISFLPIMRGMIADYSAFPANRIYIANEKTILKSEAPPWIPPFDQNFMRANAFMPPVIKDNDSYLMAASRDFKKMYRLSLDGLAATIDYYTKYQKALNQEEAKTTLEKRMEEARQWLGNKENDTEEASFLKRHYEGILKGELKVIPKSVRLLSTSRMTHSQMKLFMDNGLKKDQVWDAYRLIKDEVRQKMLDMSCQIEDLQSSYAKGTETSYGDKNTNNSLKEKYGVLVKRQNGDAIKQEEIEDIAAALDKVTSVFGDLKNISQEYGLKISHAGTKHMYARKYVGIFFDAHKAIGVSFVNKDSDFLVLAHEYGHFLDSQAGKSLNHFFASDKPGSPENDIARKFREVMNKKEKKTIDSKYLNRTCECFARAMEQHVACKLSPERYKNYCGSEAYAKDSVFMKNILPLVETLMAERRNLWRCAPLNEGMEKLRAFGVAPENNTGPRFKENIRAICKAGEYKNKLMEAAQLLIKNVLPENREALSAYLSEHGFSGPEETKKTLLLWANEERRSKKTVMETASIGR